MRKMILCALLSCGAMTLNAQEKRFEVLLNLVHHNPGEPLFTTQYTSPEYLKGLGYTGQVIKREVQCGVTYDHYPEYAIPYDCEEREWTERHAASLKVQMAQTKAAGLKNYPFTDMLVIPKSLLARYYKELVNEKGQLSILQPRTQSILRAQVEELFWRFPELDGLVIRHGETYLHDTPHHVGGSPARTAEEHALFLEILREEVCVKRNKQLFYRAWDFSGLHANPAFFKDAMAQVKPHPNLYISIKHTQRDFFRDQPFNPSIGTGHLQQIVEISTNQAGCYGKNAHPYYIGKGVIEGWSEMPAQGKKGLQDLIDIPLVKGFWTWTWGDGWSGPYFDNELWIKLNEHVIRQFALTPHRSEEDIFMEYATDQLQLSQGDAQKLRELCLLSEKAVFLGQDTQLFNASVWFSRDNYFGCLELQDAVKKDVVAEALREKHENLKRWYRIEQLAHEIQLPNPHDQEFLEVSCTYGRIKYEIYEQMWIMELMVAEKLVNGTPIPRERAQAALQAYDQKWVAWRELKKAYACCPTLYIDYKLTHTGVPFRVNLEKLRKCVTSGIPFDTRSPAKLGRVSLN